MLKILVIGALLALLILLLYSRLFPYIQALRKLLGVARSFGESSTTSTGSFGSSKPGTEKKLVRCVGCGTWIPAERAIGTGGQSSIYCSRDCLEKSTASNQRKAAS